MKLKNIDGKQYIILEANDKICITTAHEYESGYNILINENNNKIDISGDSPIVNSIRGEGMLEKIYIPPILSSQEIINNCEKWIENFKKVHDVFKQLVLSEKYRNQKIRMRLSFSKFSRLNRDNKVSNKIALYLMQNGTVIQEGMTISVAESNSDIYAYLMASVLSYYLSKNYEDTQIDYTNPNWNCILYSKERAQKIESAPIMSSLYTLYESSYYSQIVTGLLCFHNLNKPADQIIANLSARILNQQLSDEFVESLDYSNKQYKYIVSDNNEEQAILNRTLSQEE